MTPSFLSSHTSASIPFLKMEGAGNDFVLIDARFLEDPHALNRLADAGFIRKITDRRRGVGCDQLILIEKDRRSGQTLVRFFNPDASEAGTCGNGSRCAARYLFERENSTNKSTPTLLFLTRAGVLEAFFDDPANPSSVRIRLTAPVFNPARIPLAPGLKSETFQTKLGKNLEVSGDFCSLGNPHLTLFLPPSLPEKELDDLCRTYGLTLAKDPRFPAGMNVGFAQVLSPEHIRLRVFERGAGWTLACGSGAAAALVNASRLRLVAHQAWIQATIHMAGGDLQVRWSPGPPGELWLKGPAEESFHGVFPL